MIKNYTDVLNQGERKLEYENFSKSILPKEQGSGQDLVFQEENNGFSGSIQAICMQKHEDKNKTLTEMRIYGREPDYPTEERRQEFICESFKVDKNEILNQDEKLKEEIVRYCFRISFLVWQQI